MKKLAILLADLDTEVAIKSLLKRFSSSRACSLAPDDYDIFRHPYRDSGCYGGAHLFLRPYLKTHQYVLVIFDCHGCGVETRKDSSEIELDVETNLSINGWDNRCHVIVPDPELEIWVWSDSPHVAQELGWKRQDLSINEWLINKGYLAPGQTKPQHPKESMEAVLRTANKPPSPAIFSALAEKVSLHKCSDRAFLKLKNVLQRWFKQ